MNLLKSVIATLLFRPQIVPLRGQNTNFHTTSLPQLGALTIIN